MFRWESHLKYLFAICYYYYHHCYFIELRFWFLTYIYFNFENILWIKQSWVFHWIPLCLKYMFIVFFSLSFLFNIFLYIYYYYYYYYYCLCLYVLYVYMFLFEKRVRFPQGLSLVLYLYFTIFYFCIVELRVILNLNYRKKQQRQKKNPINLLNSLNYLLDTPDERVPWSIKPHLFWPHLSIN